MARCVSCMTEGVSPQSEKVEIMKYLLDTCFLFELIKKNPKQSVLHWLEGADENVLFLSVLTLGEIHKGIAKLVASRKKSSLERWLKDNLMERFEGRILDISQPVATIWGKIQGEAEQKGYQLPVIDGLIAATAMTHDLTVVTRNGKDIEKSGVQVVNPWI